MSFLKTFTQGGQITLHNIRMLRQVVRITFLGSLLMVTFYFGGQVKQETSLFQWQYLQLHILAKAKNRASPEEPWNITMPSGEKVTIIPKNFLNNPVANNHIEKLTLILKKYTQQSIMLFLCLFGGTCVFWMWRGYAKKQKEIITGSNIVSCRVLSKIIKKQNKKSKVKNHSCIQDPFTPNHFTMGHITFPHDFEGQHTLLTGTTGSGKTNCFHELLSQIRNKSQRAIVFDTTGEFVKRYYDPQKDILLNPFDPRTNDWNLWQDCNAPHQFDNFATALIPQGKGDAFWTHASRTLFSATAYELYQNENKSNKVLSTSLTTLPLKDLYTLLSDSEAASLVDPSCEKTAQSIRAHLTTYVKVFKHLKDSGEFSFRDWVNDTKNKGWVFISTTPEERETLQPLMTA